MSRISDRVMGLIRRSQSYRPDPMLPVFEMVEPRLMMSAAPQLPNNGFTIDLVDRSSLFVGLTPLGPGAIQPKNATSFFIPGATGPVNQKSIYDLTTLETGVVHPTSQVNGLPFLSEQAVIPPGFGGHGTGVAYGLNLKDATNIPRTTFSLGSLGTADLASLNFVPDSSLTFTDTLLSPLSNADGLNANGAATAAGGFGGRIDFYYDPATNSTWGTFGLNDDTTFTFGADGLLDFPNFTAHDVSGGRPLLLMSAVFTPLKFARGTLGGAVDDNAVLFESLNLGTATSIQSFGLGYLNVIGGDSTFISRIGQDAFGPGRDLRVDFQLNFNLTKELDGFNVGSTDPIQGLSVAALGDFAWEDVNRNGVQDSGEPGIPGVEVHLLNSSNTVLATTTTDANGKYLFTNLPPGDYKTEFVTPAGYQRTLQDQGGDDAKDSDIDALGRTALTNLTGGEVDLTLDAGFFRPAAIGDFVWHDLNTNGIQDAGEPGIPGVGVHLFDSGNNDIADTTTDANGLYLFSNLTPGDYHVKFDSITGFVRSPQDQGANDAKDSDADATGTTIPTTLTSGETDLTWDAGYYVNGSIHGFGYEDLNADGNLDSTDVAWNVNGLPPKKIDLFAADGTTFIATTNTNVNGQFWFLNLTPGTYVLKEDLSVFGANSAVSASPDPDGAGGVPGGADTRTVTVGDGEELVYTNGAATGFIHEGEHEVLVNDGRLVFGNYLKGSIHAFGYEDLDADGNLDSSDVAWNVPNVSPKKIDLYDSTGTTLLASQLTNAQGQVWFLNLTPGTYVLKEDLSVFGANSAVSASPDPDGPGGVPGGADSRTVTVSSGQELVYTDGAATGFIKPGEHEVLVNDGRLVFGNFLKGSIHGFGYEDLDADGNLDGTDIAWNVNGLPPKKIDLYAADGTTFIATTNTNAQGQFWFLNLLPGTYVLKEDLSVFGANSGVSASPDPDGVGGVPGGADSRTVTIGSGQELVYTNGAASSFLKDGQEEVLVDDGRLLFGNFRKAAIGDFVWNDLNANGVQDAGEPGIPNVGVHLFDASNVNVGNTTTNANGLYLFSNLTPGDYHVEFDAVPGFVRSPQDQGGDDAKDSDANASGVAIPTTLSSGETDLTWDAGYFQTAAIGDFVWHDLNANGIQDGGEVGIPNVGVHLFNNSNVNVGNTTTNASGLYLFSGLTPGDYHVEFDAVPGFVRSPADQGANDAVDSDANATGVAAVTTLSAGETDLTWDAGYFQTAAIGDFVWNDLNANGIQDGGEVGIPNVGVHLFNASNVNVGNTTTNASGLYLFSGLTPGNYHVEFDVVPGFVRSPQDQGANDAVDSDANASGVAAVTNLTSGETDLTWDAGYYQTAAIGDFVWKDLNANGIQDAGEPGISGVGVHLFNGANVNVGNTTTNASGLYLFSGLTPGNYHVEFDAVSGFVRSPADQGANDAVDSDANASGVAAVTNLSAGETDLTWDAGYYQTAAIGDFVWKDLDADGIQDAGEPGIAGVGVHLFNASNVNVGNTTTNASGLYLFSGLTPGNYHVEFDAVSGFTRSPQDQGANDAVDSDANAAGVAIVTNLTSGETDLTWDAGYIKLTPGIDLEKTTTGSPNANPIAADFDNEDAANGVGVPILTPGTAVTWTYKVTNTGNTNFAFSEIVVTDDNGTPGNAADDLSTTGGQITFLSVQTGDADNILEPGEVWLYKATGIVQNVSTPAGSTATFDFTGNSALTGTAGNIRTFSNNGVSVNVSAFSRTNSGGVFNTAYLGSYGGGLGVTDGSEDGNNNTHTVDNGGTRDNYVLFEFSNNVVVDTATLGYVVGDSDMTVWIGTIPNAFNSHQTLSDALLTSLGFTEVNLGAGSTRTADINSGNLSGNVLVIAAKTDEYDDFFKISAVCAKQPGQGIYENKGTVTAQGLTDSDLSHYKNPVVKQSISGHKYKDLLGDGLTPDDTGLGGVTIKLFLDKNNNGKVDAADGSAVATTTTAADGSYAFNNLATGIYLVQEVVPTGFIRTAPTNTDTYCVTLSSGQNVTGKDFANFEQDCDLSRIQGVYYIINGCTKVYDLSGNIHQGDQVQVCFTYAPGADDEIHLVTYTAPHSTFIASEADEQVVFDQDGGVVHGGQSYCFTVQVPNCYFQIDFVCGPVIYHFGPDGSNIFYTPQGRLKDADNGGTSVCYATPGSVAGFVYQDDDCDGVKDGSEAGIAGTIVKLSGTDKWGKAVSLTRTTDSDGSYSFKGLTPGTYKVVETQPGGFTDGKETLGTGLGGNATTNDTFANLVLAAGVNGANYNFGERAMIGGGDTGSVGYWCGTKGQNLIKCLNGGSSSKTLCNYLASKYGKTFGANAGTCNLTGKTNSQLCDLIKTWSSSKQLECTYLCAALSDYVTDSAQCGFVALSYGFCVGTGGCGNKAYNVGSNGSAFGVSNNTLCNLDQLLAYTDSQSSGGSCYGGNSSKRTYAQNVYSAICNLGGVS